MNIFPAGMTVWCEKGLMGMVQLGKRAQPAWWAVSLMAAVSVFPRQSKLPCTLVGVCSLCIFLLLLFCHLNEGNVVLTSHAKARTNHLALITFLKLHSYTCTIPELPAQNHATLFCSRDLAECQEPPKPITLAHIDPGDGYMMTMVVTIS